MADNDQFVSQEDQAAQIIQEARESGMISGGANAPVPDNTQPQTSAGQPQPSPQNDPFDGFSQLDSTIQERLRKLLGDKESEFSRIQRENATLRGRVDQLPKLQSELQRLRRTAQQTPSVQTDAALQAELKQWDEHKNRFPDEAQAIEERILAIKRELEGRYSPLTEELGHLREQVDKYAERESAREAVENEKRLDDMAPGWRRVAGWEDANGNPIANPMQRGWAPEFDSWRNALPPRIREQYNSLIDDRDVDSIAAIINHFNRDYWIAMQSDMGTGNSAPRAVPQAPVANKRQAALNDVSPTGSGGGGLDGGKFNPTSLSREDQAANAIAQFQDRWNRASAKR